MNAPHAATCPTCGGSGERVRAWDMSLLGGKRGQRVLRCLACRGSGQVDPMRVCPACGQWTDQCTCPKSKIIKLWKVDEMNGVVWVEKDQRWRVEFSKDGDHYYLGQFADKAMAAACRMEADHTPVEDYPALRKKYAALKKAAAQPVAPEPKPAATHAIGLSREEYAATVAELEKADPMMTSASRAADLNAKLTAALAADRRFRDIREQYCAAERDAVEAWNEYARELALSGQSDAFAKSYLGFLREEITRP